MIRFIHIFNYPEDVSYDDGEEWYLHEHAPQVRKLPGVVRYRSWKQFDNGISFPNNGVPSPFDQFVRRTELCFQTLQEALESVMGNQQLWTSSAKGVPGFGEFECMFLDEEPEFNLLQDAPQQQYKYMTLPLWWPKGRPEYDDAAEIFIDSYCLAYRAGVTVTMGEDWYLGHHTREGKQLPGMKHYKTWKTIRVPEDPNSTLEPNKWFRLTELGMSPDAYLADMVNDDTRIRFTPSPHGNVIGKWINISIKLGQVEDLLE